MIPVTNLRTGIYFTDGKDLFQVLNYEHIKLGRGTANIKLKTKNLKTGSILEKTFISGAKVEEAILEKKEAQFLYRDSKTFYFMNLETFEQFELSGDKVSRETPFLKGGEKYKILFYHNEPLTLELPIKIDFIVSQTGPELRGNSATNIFKEAVLENGLRIKVPLFVKVGDRVLVDTRTCEYEERIR